MRGTHRNFALALVTLAALGATSSAQIRPAAEHTKAIADVVYGKAGDRELHMDLLIPEGSTDAKRPAVAWIHGGGWSKGTHKQNRAAFLADHGYVVASVEYRLTGDAIFPAQIEDCKAAIRYLRANAVKYGIDPDRIGVMGGSAGGHLVALLGTSGDVKKLEGSDGSPGVSSRVQAVCDFYGPTDFTVRPSPVIVPAPVRALLGGSPKDKPELAALASPVKHVTKDDAPTLIIHGERDMVVPINQSERLYDALKRAGVEVEFVRVKNAGHGFTGTGIQPDIKAIEDTALRFFDKHLNAGN